MIETERIDEGVAAAILTAALRESRCSELIEALWSGGSATIDLHTGRLLIVSGEQLA